MESLPRDGRLFRHPALKLTFVMRAASVKVGSVPPLRLKIATTALKTSTPAKTDNRLEGNRFPDFTNGGFKEHLINGSAALALGGSEPKSTDAALCTNGGYLFRAGTQ